MPGSIEVPCRWHHMRSLEDRDAFLSPFLVDIDALLLPLRAGPAADGLDQAARARRDTQAISGFRAVRRRWTCRGRSHVRRR